MGHAARIISRSLWLVCLGAWSWVMVVLGLILILDVPMYVHLDVRPFWMLGLGAALVAGGVFCMAATLAPLLPRTNAAVTVLSEFGPWVALAGVLIGGVL